MADKDNKVEVEREELEEMEFDELISNRTKRYTKDCETGSRWRTAMTVTLTKRFNNDYHGYWDTQMSSWLDVPSQGLMKWPVLGPVIRANDANWISTRIKNEIDSTSSDPAKKGAEVVAEAIFDYLYRRDWTARNEQMMSQYCQLGFVYGLYSGFSKHVNPKKVKVPKLKEAEIEPEEPEWYCSSCGVSGPATDLATEKGQDLAGAQKCPSCGKQSAHVDEPEGESSKIEIPDGYDELTEGDNFTKVVPSLLFMVDEVNSKAGNAEDAQYVNYNRLSRRYELKALYKEAADGLTPQDGKDWLDSVRWWHALETGATVKEDKPLSHGAGKLSDDDLLQERHWWFRPAVLGAWTSPSNYKHSCGFKIKKGQTIQEAFEAQGKEFKGLYVCTVGKKVMYIDTEDHLDCWSFGLWMMNGSSFYGKAQQELLDIQEAANEWFTMFFEYGERASMPQTIAHRQFYNAKDFDNRAGGVILTKKGMGTQIPISRTVMRLEPARLSSDLFTIFELLDKGKDEISGVSKAATGQGDPSQRTLGGQALLTQRSQGLMVPSQKSKADAQSLWGKQQLKFAQRHWSDDKIKTILAKIDKSWDEENIAAFRLLDIDRELNIEAAEGTDVPITFHEKAQNLIAVAASGILWNPQVPVEIREQIAHFVNVDYDPQNIEAERRRQQTVYDKIEAAVKYVENQGMGYIQDPQSGQIMVNPQAVQQIQTMPGIKILPRSENLKFAKDFFDKYIVALSTVEHPDELLVAVLQDRIDQMMLADAQNMQAAAVASGAIQGQAQAAAGATGGGQEQGGAGKDPRMEAAEADKKRTHDIHMTTLKHQHAKELLQMKADQAQDADMSAKVPPAPRYSAFAE